MQKLDKARTTELADLVRRLEAAKSALETEVDRFNAILFNQFDEVKASVDSYNDLVRETNDFLAATYADMEIFFSEKSERWQEGERGEAYSTWMNEWGISLGDIQIDAVDEIEMPDCDHAEQLENLPRDPE